MLEKQDHRAITINNQQDANIITHYKRTTYITWFTQDGIRPHRNFQSFYYYTFQQNEGIQPTINPLHFLFTPSQSLSHNHRDHFYNATIQYTTLLQCLPFIKGIPWENTTGFPKPWAHKSPIIDQFMSMKLQHFTRHFSKIISTGTHLWTPPLKI